MRNSENLFAVEDILISVDVLSSRNVRLVTAKAVVDLAEFQLTEEEIKKFDTILQIIGSRLLEDLEKYRYSAVSVKAGIYPEQYVTEVF
jgi:hypothetical protein